MPMFSVLSEKIHLGVLDDVGQSLEPQNVLSLALGLLGVLIPGDTAPPQSATGAPRWVEPLVRSTILVPPPWP